MARKSIDAIHSVEAPTVDAKLRRSLVKWAAPVHNPCLFGNDEEPRIREIGEQCRLNGQTKFKLKSMVASGEPPRIEPRQIAGRLVTGKYT